MRAEHKSMSLRSAVLLMVLHARSFNRVNAKIHAGLETQVEKAMSPNTANLQLRNMCICVYFLLHK